MSRAFAATIILNALALVVLIYLQMGPATLWKKVVSPRGDISWPWFLANYLLLGVILILLVTTVSIYIKNAPLPRASEPPLQARLHALVVSRFPGPLVYVYDSRLGKLIAPIGVAMFIEVVNSRPTAARIYSYTADVEIKGRWVRIYSLPILNPLDVFWVNDSNLQTATRLDFRSNSFDALARGTSLQRGESLKGWMFFEWPPELRTGTPHFQKVRLRVENSQGESEIFVLESKPQAPGESSLPGGTWVVPPQQEKTDLSNYRVLPYTDLLKMP